MDKIIGSIALILIASLYFWAGRKEENKTASFILYMICVLTIISAICVLFLN
jgi:hypothetical protein